MAYNPPISKPTIPSFKWYGFDLDGTIADNSSHTAGFGEIGRPIKPMIQLMKRLHRDGYDVRIFTARVGDVGKNRRSLKNLKKHIWEWCDKHLGFRPPITDRKDSLMECAYDDRAKQVVRNKGYCYEDIALELARCLNLAMAKREMVRDKKLFERCQKAINKLGK